MAKSIEKWTEVLPTSFGDRQDPSRAAIGRIVELAAGTRVQPHSHLRSQVIHAPRGPLRVVTEAGSWSVPVNQAVWVPAGTEHAVIARMILSIRTLFIDPAVAHGMPDRCQVFRLSPLLRELLQRTAALGDSYPVAGPEQRLMAVVLDELRALEPEPLHLPLAKDARVRKIMDALMDNPSDNRGLEAWADTAGATVRTLVRGFRRETGLTFSQWRTRLRLIEGLERLQRGQAVTRVALELGYTSPSAFIAMFRRELGVSPGALRQVQK